MKSPYDVVCAVFLYLSTTGIIGATLGYLSYRKKIKEIEKR
jgi:hypothetical protein